jgi:uncharacterized protein (TIGR02001 family)
MTKKTFILAAAISSVLTSGVAMADLTGNVAATTDYIWRGVTQTADNAAVSGGLDWSDASGVYAGVWTSTFNFAGAGFEGQEVDIYGGFAGEAGDIGYDVGVITYQYPVAPGSNFTEVYLTGSFDIVSLGAYFTVDKASGIADPAGNDSDLYLNASVDLDPFSVWIGSYSFDANSAADYIHYGVSMSKDDVTFALEKNDIDAASGGDETSNNLRFTVSWSKEFDI